MACTAAVSFGSTPSMQMGMACNFIVTITNGTGSNTNIQSLVPVFRKPDGTLFPGASVGAVQSSAQLSQAQVNGNQFNVPVNNGSSVSFGFSATVVGPAISGGPTQPSMQLFLDVLCSTSDGSSFSCASGPIVVNVNQPQFGQGAGAPPNPTSYTGQVDFQAALNSNLISAVVF